MRKYKPCFALYLQNDAQNIMTISLAVDAPITQAVINQGAISAPLDKK